jgi:hypothetical protein
VRGHLVSGRYGPIECQGDRPSPNRGAP